MGWEYNMLVIAAFGALMAVGFFLYFLYEDRKAKRSSQTTPSKK